MAFNWDCPHCNRSQTVTENMIRVAYTHLYLPSLAEGKIGVTHTAIECANSECSKLSLGIEVHGDKYVFGNWARNDEAEPIIDMMLIPQGSARPQPEYIPVALRDDYREACLIRDLSPKASATLIRRCLQGMIRDFCKIAKGSLVEEIRALRAAIDEGTSPPGVTIESVDAIDHVRGIGNIGAHMEKDINLIVDVEIGEVRVLIELVETLFEEWYVNRHTRSARFGAIAAVAEKKRIEIAALRAPSA